MNSKPVFIKKKKIVFDIIKNDDSPACKNFLYKYKLFNCLVDCLISKNAYCLHQ